MALACEARFRQRGVAIEGSKTVPELSKGLAETRVEAVILWEDQSGVGGVHGREDRQEGVFLMGKSEI